MRLLLCVFVVALLGCKQGPRPENGVYVTAREVFGFQSEILELRNGRFRYWILSDVGPAEPFERSGDYTRDGDRIVMPGKATEPQDRLLVQGKGGGWLLRSDSEELWKKENRLAPYGTLIRVPHTFEEMIPPRDFDKTKWNALLSKLPVLTKTEQEK
jgi:hypothetical protein